MSSISIHAPVKGATCSVRVGASSRQYFNPRTREGCDQDRVLQELKNAYISIHAPVKGATCQAPVSCKDAGDISIHAPVKGATTVSVPTYTSTAYFNPRTREGCDCIPDKRSSRFWIYFNPRTREGCDKMSRAMNSLVTTFQSTHP